MARQVRRPSGLVLTAFVVLALAAGFAITTSILTSKTIDQSATSHGSQGTSGSATNQPQPTRTDTVR